MPCFYLSFSHGLEKYVYEVFGAHHEPRENYYYPDAYSLLFTASDMDEAKNTVRRMLPSPLDAYDRYLLMQVFPGFCDGACSGLECRQWLERHGL